MVLYTTLGVCAVLAALLVYRYDLYEREPVAMLLVAAVAGIGVMWAMGPLESFTLRLIGAERMTLATIAAVAATHEELGRLAIVATLAVLLPTQINDPMDGLIYGSIAGLGMAVQESVFYVRAWGVEDGLLPPTEIVRLFGHMVLGGITAFAVGMARTGMRGWGRVLAGCLTLTMSLHFLWDWVALSARREGHMAPWQTAAAVAIMLTAFAAYGALVVIGSRWSRERFAPDSARSVWGWPFGGVRP